MPVTNWINSPNPRRKPSIIAWACCVVCTASITDRRLPAATTTSSASIRPDPRSATARRTELVTRGLRLRQPRRVVVPGCAEEVARFWRSFRTFRDLALVGLMLLDGLRSCEVLALRLEDLQLADAHMLVFRQRQQET